MTIWKVKRKENKIGIRYYLRKEQGKSVVKIVDDKEIPHYPLYVEFTHRRKQNKCKSLFLKFYSEKCSISYNDIERFGISVEDFNEDFGKFINSKAPAFRTYKLDFQDLLMCEKQHIQSLFNLFKDIPDNEFSLATLAKGYPYSLQKRAYNLCDEVLKELLIDKFIQLVPTFPIELIEPIRMYSASYTYYNCFDLLLKVFNCTAEELKTEISGEGLINLGSSLADIEKRISEYMTTEHNSLLVLTIPIWLVEEHSNKLSMFLLDESKNMDSLLVSNFIAKLDVKITEEVSSIKNLFKGER